MDYLITDDENRTVENSRATENYEFCYKGDHIKYIKKINDAIVSHINIKNLPFIIPNILANEHLNKNKLIRNTFFTSIFVIILQSILSILQLSYGYYYAKQDVSNGFMQETYWLKVYGICGVSLAILNLLYVSYFKYDNKDSAPFLNGCYMGVFYYLAIC